MSKSKFGVSAVGIKCPIIHEGDDVEQIVVDSILSATYMGSTVDRQKDVRGKTTNAHSLVRKNLYDIENKDVFGITESIVARAQGNYVTVDEIADYIKQNYGEKNIILLNPIYSRNRFSMILKGIARAAKEKVAIYMPDFDEVGNPRGVNPFTGVNMEIYYGKIVGDEGKEYSIHPYDYEKTDTNEIYGDDWLMIYCGLHDFNEWKSKYGGNPLNITLADVCSDKCEFGVLGSNKATEERLKLFPTKEFATKVCYGVKNKIKDATGKDVIVICNGDGCFHSPGYPGIIGSSINECADPVCCPGYTDPEIVESCPNEGKLKYYADLYPELTMDELMEKIRKDKGDNNIGKMTSEGVTPRRREWLWASLFDLITGSGDRGTPIVRGRGLLD